MNATPDSTLTDPQQRISDLERQLAEREAELAECKAERDERTAERDEALEQQTATAEVLQVINSSPGDLAPVFDAILEKAHALCGTVHGALTLYDGTQFRVAAMHDLPAKFAELLREPFPPFPGGSQEQLLRGAPLVHVPDVTAREPITPIQRASVAAGIRTLLMVPLRKDGRLLGYITANRREVLPFSDKQIALLQNFAQQAVIAMENARLINETREALEQQTATAEVLGVINASPGNLTPVFDALLEKAMRLCEAAFGVFWTFEGEIGQVAALSGVPPAFAEFLTRGPFRETSTTANSRLRRGENLVQIADSEDDDAYRSGEPVRRAMVELGGARTMLAVPLRKDGTLLGSFIIYRQNVRLFSDKQIALLQNFAAQAVIAMENARLINETREALEQQTATAEVLGVINSSPGDLGPVFDAVLEKAMRQCGASFGELRVYEGDERFRTVAIRGVPTAFAEHRRQNAPVSGPNSLGARVLAGERIIHIADLKEDAAYRQGDANRRSLVDLGGARSALAVALRQDEKVLGFITLYRQEVRAYANKQIALLQNFAAQAVIAMENARLITETREALEQQTATAEVLGVINSSPGDVVPVFDAMVERAMRLCDADEAMVRTYDGEALQLASAHGKPEIVERLRQLGPSYVNGLYEPLGRGESVIHIADVRETNEFRDSPRRRERMEVQGIRSWLVVALRKDNALLGVINVIRCEVRPFSDKQIALLQNFADQAVIALENARLLGELRQRTEEVAELNRGLEARVAEQVDELGRVGRLKRFLAPQLAELIVSHGDEKILESHRREIVVVFCDLRGYTAFTETAEPEEVLDFLRQYHGALGPLVSQFEGTLDQFSGDGIMVFFNDPVPCPDPAERAVKMAMAMRDAAGKLIAAWRRHGSELGFGAGIAQGYATLGQIGFSDRSGYTAIGTVCNLAARLCAEAKDGQILVSSRIAEAVEAVATLEDLGNLDLRGLRRPVAAFNVAQSTGAPDVPPNLTVVDGEPGA